MPNQIANILILGLGGVGYYLAKRLSHEGHAITAIERSSDLINRADGELDARLIRGNVMSFSCWREAQAEGMDYLIAVTDNDAVNIMASMIADRIGIQRCITRVRTLQLWERDAPLTADDLNIDLIIRPEELTALEIARLLKMRAGNVVVDVAQGDMQVVATRIGENSSLAHMHIKDISKMFDDFHFRIVAIARGINTIIPKGDDELLPHDHVYVLAKREDLPRMMEIADVSEERRHRVLIIGGGFVGRRVAELLEDSFPLTLVELDEHRAEELSYHLRKTECLHGNGSEPDTLIKAGLLNMDTIIATTGDNETNIMTSVLAKHLISNKIGDRKGHEGKTIALVQREEYLVLASSMGADIVLNKKVLAANEILKYIRRGRLLSMAHLHGCDAEVVELVPDEGAPITCHPLYALPGLRDGVLIGGVMKDGTWQIAVGSTEIKPGERVIGICTSDRLKELQGLFLS